MPKSKHRWKTASTGEPGFYQRQEQDTATGSTVVQEHEKRGRRIVELSVLGQQLWCVSCKEALSLTHIENEHRRGLGSILLIRCHKCSVVNTCCTDKRHESALDERNIRFDINFKAAMGTLQTGIGWTHFNKLLACMNIPTIDFKTYKRYKEQVENVQNKKELVKIDSSTQDTCQTTTELHELM